MGFSISCLTIDNGFSITDLVSIVGILVNAGLAYWIVRTIQNNLTNKRVLKDHFIAELKEIRNEYKTCLSNLYSNKSNSKSIIPWFKLMNIRVTDLVNYLNKKYKVDLVALNPYQNELRELVTNNADFISQFKSKKPIVFSDISRLSLIKFQQEHNHIFNDLIVKINDCN